jgi:hypothetical protein
MGTLGKGILPLYGSARVSIQLVLNISDFRELNKCIVRKPYPISKISTTLQELEGFTYATTLDLNMGYYTIRLDLTSAKNVHYHISLGKLLLSEIADGIFWIGCHFPSRNGEPNGYSGVPKGIH